MQVSKNINSHSTGILKSNSSYCYFYGGVRTLKQISNLTV